MTLATALPETLTALAEEALSLAELAVLAVLQGLTEFLPISSSGHLVLAQSAMGLGGPALALDVALHLGTLAAVVLVYRADLVRLVRGLFTGDLAEPLRLVVGTIPAGLVGVLLQEHVQEAFHSTRVAAAGLLGTALILGIGERARRRALDALADAPEAVGGDEIPSYRQALSIGCAQALAILPGISRSGSTISAGVLVGLDPRVAARFSFLLSIPAILGAAVLSLPSAVREGVAGGLGPVLVGMLLAGAVGWGALRLLLATLGRGAFLWFAVYCALLGALALPR